ncbi:MAG: hypothetical protein CM1200mP10_02170 [Candidatus Neomarinimicrobiota bacterium]|nr:MAG: hypothetical protein CM1200mP10_02170 [Candidatus Neomarinimicrobiota bacterium]
MVLETCGPNLREETLKFWESSLIGNGNHIRFRVKQDRTLFPAIGFNLSKHYEDLINGSSVDLAFVVEVNEWRAKGTFN